MNASQRIGPTCAWSMAPWMALPVRGAGTLKGSAGHKEQEPWLRPGHLCSASDLLSGSGLLGAFLRLPLCAGGQGGASLSAEKVLYTRHQRCATPLRSSHYLGGPVARRP